MSTNTKSGKAIVSTKPSNEQRRNYVEVAAYYIAESREFNCGCDLENWLAAEAKIDRLLAEGKL